MSDRPNSPDSRRGLPLRGAKRTHNRIIVAHHLIFTGYGHWLPNDPRGSGSGELRQQKLNDLGPIHKGRKRVQPPRDELREFQRRAEPLLEFDRLWFDGAKRQAVGDAFGALVDQVGFTVWACAILRNHAHLCVRRHRDDAQKIWDRFADAARDALRVLDEVPDDHPIWSNRPYKKFLYTPTEVRRVIGYIEENPEKEGLPLQTWPFVKAYDGWPHTKSCS